MTRNNPLKRIILFQGKTQTELAKSIKKSRKTVNNWVKYPEKLSREKLKMLAKGLRMPLSKLMEMWEEMEKKK